jgi:LDH2 family malate/lactate/ureidoglycolate dehydrogenase
MQTHIAETIRVAPDLLETRVLAALTAAGADQASAKATTRALMHASRLGIDSHGVRLTPHYARMMRTGRVNPTPRHDVKRTGWAVAMLDADNGLGHGAAYAAMDLACELAQSAGIGAVGVVRSSHFGAAGAYAFAGAEAGAIAISVTNADSLVGMHHGRRAFHGTNPIAAAAPVPGQRPWLLDMATSSIPLNRVLLYRTLGRALPDGVAADANGMATTVPALATMLIPLGGIDFGYKGAGLGGLVTILSAVLTGGALDHDIMPMFHTDDFSTPRNLGHFCLAIDPEKFVGRAGYEAAMLRYMDALRAVPAAAGERVMAPGDREWDTEAERMRSGIPVDREAAAYLDLAES